jgi:hypothetical protein
MMSRGTPTVASSEGAISDQMLGELSNLERADLLKRLQELTASEFALSRHLLTARRWFIGLLAVCCVALIPWTIGLGFSLPRTYVAANWQVLWTFGPSGWRDERRVDWDRARRSHRCGAHL